MGACASTGSAPVSVRGAAASRSAKGDKSSKKAGYEFYTIKDKYRSMEAVADGLRSAGLESSQLIISIDYTKSNQWTGKKSFAGRCLHTIDPTGAERNPYMLVIESLGKCLAPFDDDNLIPVFGFGDTTTTDRSVFPFFAERPSHGFQEVVDRYIELTPRVVLSGPTNFAPAIEAAIQVVKETNAYHILVIIADGQVTNVAHTEASIVRASEYPLSILVVGVGDGPWETMTEFDDALPARKFDNFQFVNFSKVWDHTSARPDIAFAVAALMEIPEQFLAIRKLGYI